MNYVRSESTHLTTSVKKNGAGFVEFRELFTFIVDMLSVLIHGTLASDSSEKGEENKKVYQNLIRKLKVLVIVLSVIIIIIIIINDNLYSTVCTKVLQGLIVCVLLVSNFFI